MGSRYEYGDGVRQDFERAGYWFKRAAAQGHSMAAFRMALLLAGGKGVRESMREAICYCWQAADGGNADALNWLGYAYDNGEGVAQNIGKACELYRAAAQKGCEDAYQNLGVVYQTQGRFESALYGFKHAAKAGHACGMFNLGNLLDKDLNRPQEAVKWYERSASERFIGAQISWGLLYLTGRGVKQDFSKAVELFSDLALTDNDPDGIFNFAYMLRCGFGIKQDLPAAVKLYNWAISLGFSSDYQAGVLRNDDVGWRREVSFLTWLMENKIPITAENFVVFRNKWELDVLCDKVPNDGV